MQTKLREHLFVYRFLHKVHCHLLFPLTCIGCKVLIYWQITDIRFLLFLFTNSLPKMDGHRLAPYRRKISTGRSFFELVWNQIKAVWQQQGDLARWRISWCQVPSLEKVFFLSLFFFHRATQFSHRRGDLQGEGVFGDRTHSLFLWQ